MPQKEPFSEYNNVVFLICNSMLFIITRGNHMQTVISVNLISFLNINVVYIYIYCIFRMDFHV